MPDTRQEVHILFDTSGPRPWDEEGDTGIMSVFARRDRAEEAMADIEHGRAEEDDDDYPAGYLVIVPMRVNVSAPRR